MTIDQLKREHGEVLAYDARLNRWCIVSRCTSGTIWGQFDEPFRTPGEQAELVHWQPLPPSPMEGEEP